MRTMNEQDTEQTIATLTELTHEEQATISDFRKRLDEIKTKKDALQHKESKITIEIDSKDLRKIQEIVGKVERYDTVEKFVSESLKNMTIMWLEPEKMDEVTGDLWNDLTPDMKKVFREKVPDYYNMLDQKYGIHTKVATMANEISTVKAVLSKHTFPEPENTVLGYYDKKSGSDVYPYIHETYNRFFPLKILVTSLASLIHVNLRSGKTEWIDYEEFSKECFELSLEFSDKLKKIKTAEKKYRIEMNVFQQVYLFGIH